ELYLSICSGLATAHGATVLISSPFAIDKYTRFLSYYYPTKLTYPSRQQLSERPQEVEQLLANVNATHVVTKIKYGIHVIVILQLSPKHVSDLDDLLGTIRKQLTTHSFNIDADNDLFRQFSNMKVFSNVSDIANSTKLAQVCQKIINIQSNIPQHPPLEYTLRPITTLCPSYPPEKSNYIQLNQPTMYRYLYELFYFRKKLKVPVNPITEESILKYFKEEYAEIQQQPTNTEELFKTRMIRMFGWISKIRRGDIDQKTITEPLVETDDKILLQKTRDAAELLDLLIEKVELIDSLNEQDIVYWNVKDIIADDDINQQRIEKKLLTRGKQKRIFCCDDKVEKQPSTLWNNLLKQSIDEQKTNDLVYADFTFCSYYLPQAKTLSLEIIVIRQKSIWEDQTFSAVESLYDRLTLNESKLTSDRYINILLLGECGVGKSTFINAIMNYFQFDTIEKARNGQPIALIPVAFTLTVGDEFNERHIQYGDLDLNEDHFHPGQSFTQQCRSYIFPIGKRTKIRFIDTPGMGDTRGFNQDDVNLQHILSFITNLSHLNAVCIFLKPNESRLNIVFRSYFTRLVGYLGENIRNNIIFCFTNTRATFFAPGNTGPVMKKMLASHHIKNISLKKANTFCFDNEALRYLIGLKKKVKFDDYQREEYKRSWMRSVDETVRLLDYISNNLKPYTESDWQSAEHAYYLINQMIRPTLETIRNNIRNAVLLQKDPSKSLIQLHPKPTPKTATICLQCERFPVLHCEFWILFDVLHRLSEKCDTCECDISKHTKLRYVLEYKTWDDKKKPSFDETKDSLDELWQSTIKFAEFFRYIVLIPKTSDPILDAINRIIAEEKRICLKNKQNGTNIYLYNQLKQFREEYEKVWSDSVSSRKHITLSEVYKQIKNISKDSTVNEQMSVIKQAQEQYINESEKQVTF
ncbi:unnamed protein product, partial [Adineta steineri]